MSKILDVLVGKTIKSITLNKSADEITFTFNEGKDEVYSVDGDCCSNSWIEHITVPNDVDGAKVLSCTNLTMDTKDNVIDEYGFTHESLQYYETRISTNKGDIVLEYRNSSNGYYGGYLTRKDKHGKFRQYYFTDEN